MLGLLVLGAVALYFLISLIVVILAVGWAREHGRSKWRWGLGAGLIMYLLVFWDFIPTLIVHKYYCATAEGFWVYKTVEQWKKENPGIAQTLTWKRLSDSYKKPNGTSGYILNERFFSVYQKRQPVPLIPVFVNEDQVVDMKNGEIMARQVSVGSGNGNFVVSGLGEGRWKFWLNLPSCHASRGKYAGFRRTVKELGTRHE